MNRKFALRPMLTLALSMSSSLASAQPGPLAAPDETRAQATNDAGAAFDRLDANHDGLLTRDELRDGRPDWHRPPGAGAPPPDSSAAPPPLAGWAGPAHGEHGPMLGMIFRRADPGHSGSVSRAAFITAAQSLFDEADTNHDGVLTAAERNAARQKMRAAMQARWQHRRDGGPTGAAPPTMGAPGGPSMPPPPAE